MSSFLISSLISSCHGILSVKKKKKGILSLTHDTDYNQPVSLDRPHTSKVYDS